MEACAGTVLGHLEPNLEPKALSSAEAPSVGKRRENGEIKKSRARWGRWEVSPARSVKYQTLNSESDNLSFEVFFLFFANFSRLTAVRPDAFISHLPSFPALYFSPLPIPHFTGKTKETSAEEREPSIEFLRLQVVSAWPPGETLV